MLLKWIQHKLSFLKTKTKKKLTSPVKQIQWHNKFIDDSKVNGKKTIKRKKAQQTEWERNKLVVFKQNQTNKKGKNIKYILIINLNN